MNMNMKKSGVRIIACMLVLASGSLLYAKTGENTKIYTVFVSRGYGGAGGAPESIITNEKLLDELKNECKGIDFIVKDTAATLRELERSREGVDGVLIIGTSREYKLAFTGLPTIIVYNLFEWMNVPYKLYNTGKEQDSILVGGPKYQAGKILTAQLDRRNVCSPSSSSAMFKDLVEKVKLIQAIKKLKETRILVVQPYHYLASVDYQGDRHKHFPENYNETYTRALKESLGVELVRAEPKEFYEAVKKADEKEAEEIAKKWIDEAQGMRAAESEVIKTAKSYLAFEALRRKYNCNAVSTHMRTLTGSGKVEDRFWPGLGLECGFKTRGIQAVCQSYPNILVTELLGYYLTGRPSMLGDLMIDTFNNISLITHCGAPINPYGDERRVPYIIRTHAESPVRNTQKPGSSTGLQVEWPIGEPVTMWKVYVLHKKIGLHTGKTADGHSLYKDFDSIMCRTKLVVKVDDAKKIQKHFSPDEYGIHRVGTLGDLRDRIKDLATLIGFEVMEEDK